MKSTHAHEQSLLTKCKKFYILQRRRLSVYELWWNLGDSQHAQDSTSNNSKSCQVSRLPALLGGKNRFCFFACNKHTTIVFGFYIFPQNFELTQNPGHGFASSSSSLCGSGGMFSDISMVSFFFPCSQPFFIPVHFWQVPALRAAAPGHVLFQSQPFFLGSTSLHLIPIKSAIVVC